MRSNRTLNALAVFALLMLGIAGIPSAFAGDDTGAKSGDACCAEKGEKTEVAGVSAEKEGCTEGEKTDCEKTEVAGVSADKECCAAKGEDTEVAGVSAEKECCKAKGVDAENASMDLEACDDPAKAGEARQAGWPRVGVVTAAGYFPVNTCAVTGETLNPDSKKLHSFDFEGRLIAVCCPGCESKFRADSARFIANLDTMIKEQQGAVYPLTTCPTSGGELGGMGEPVEMITGNYLVRLCCGGCKAPVEADPAATIAQLEKFYSEVVGEAAADTTEVASVN